MIADHIASTHGGEANGFPGARAGLAFTAVHGHLVQITPQRLGHHLTHAQCSPRRRVNLVPVVSLDDLDIHLVTQYTGSGIQQLQAQIDAHAEVGGKNDRNLFGRRRQLLLLLGGETSGANHHGFPGTAADLQVFQGHRRMGKVDQHIESIDDCCKITHQRHAQPPHTGQLTGISPNQAAVRAINRCRQLRISRLLHRFDKVLAHAPSGAHYCDTLHSISSKLQGSSCKPSTTPSCGL